MKTTKKPGNSRDGSFGDTRKQTAKSIEDWLLDERRFEERVHYHERMEYRCTVIGPRGFAVKCRKDCSECSYYRYRKPNKVSIDQLAESGLEFASDDESPSEYAQRRELEEKVEEAIGSLPSEDLRVCARMFRDSRSFAEIGKALGISKQAAHKKWEKAKGLLREALQGYWDSINS